MNLKHIKVALRCIPVYSFSSAPPPLVQRTVLEPRGRIERGVDAPRSGSVTPFDLIAVNTTLVKRRNLCIRRASVRAAGSSRACMSRAAWRAGGGSGPASHVFQRWRSVVLHASCVIAFRMCSFRRRPARSLARGLSHASAAVHQAFPAPALNKQYASFLTTTMQKLAHCCPLSSQRTSIANEGAMKQQRSEH